MPSKAEQSQEVGLLAVSTVASNQPHPFRLEKTPVTTPAGRRRPTGFVASIGPMSAPSEDSSVAIGIAGSRAVGTIALEKCDRVAAGVVSARPHR